MLMKIGITENMVAADQLPDVGESLLVQIEYMHVTLAIYPTYR